ncbi:delta-lactam-biosynthetic de-N-acetylase [Mesobacillus foraminis]|uniref:delta-lactam-biosynthetic de-N-acetylase n=1 Tax=Mesobacillus foraminis TaxID=279826 RepID=UPI000EF537AF
MRRIYKLLLAISVLFLMTGTLAYAEFPNKPIGWGFKKGREGKPADAGKPLEQLIGKYGAVYKGDPNKKDIYLTFDNGYENGYTDQILDVLKKEKVPAAFFVTGHYLESAEDQVIRMVEDGHIVGNHSYHHPDLTKVSDEKLKEELELVRSKTQELTGQKHMSYLRPPRGVFSERTMQLAREAGYTHIFWSLAFVDWNTDQQRGWQYSYDNIMRQIHPGAILLLHTVSKDNADALEKAIQDLKKQGYTFKSLDDLMLSGVLKDPMLY